VLASADPHEHTWPVTSLAPLLALLASLGYGTGDFLGGVASRRAPIVAVVAWAQLAGLLVLGLALPWLPAATPTARDFLWGAAAGLAGGVGLAGLFAALARGRMSTVAPITAVCTLVVPVLVGIVLGERPSAQAAVGVVLGVLAVVFLSRAPGDTPAAAGQAGAVPLALAAGVVIGVFMVMLGKIDRAAGLWPLVSARLVSLALFGIAAAVSGRLRPPDRAGLGLMMGSGVMDMTANVLYVLAARDQLLSLVATLTALYPASTVILARFVLGERMASGQAGGLVAAGLAILLIVTG
jgi:drug/metabolite transporter (DMT)-like permease